MFLFYTRVLDRHFVAGEWNHARSQAYMFVKKRSFEQRRVHSRSLSRLSSKLNDAFKLLPFPREGRPRIGVSARLSQGGAV
jgi:hypothetical protein